ncbi:MAG: hypothetical protein US60_C0026G0004 [Microgenomates group bacterium GW2011_GWC1_37_8]|uniref:UDP-N-acetylglucosamine kinase n=1 Tax=Candidatus Woesebacteria bacterium GW2011_GWB1_38_8 TaxID=1618570 RepID=A0A0G0LCP9_9BACT|nr:MAG: hypothetical protein US60_C0026G0004 [Microgenomates group bacterium GW2011_GWC1_37_8]KKQ85655.1 MAG: hypothetical protein UT08_C0005G0106 [Candidatus Woesebacteria bacterium GW2011_GWB1_38_8]
MSPKPKLIILNGFAGSGKTTIAKRYIDAHPLAINIEGDEIIAMIGKWKTNYKKARVCVYEHTKIIIATHLKLRYDVVVPYLLVDASHAEVFEKIAAENSSNFYEILLYTEKEEAIKRLMERGTWGEKDLPDLTEKDIPKITDLFDRLVKATAKRPNTITLKVRKDDIDGTYRDFKEIIENKGV